MRTPLASLLVVLGALVAREARADGDEPPPAAPAPSPTPLRIGGALTGGWSILHRTVSEPSNVDGAMLGGELRVHPGAHGFFLGYSHADAVFGPSVNVVDAGYSLRLVAPPELRGVTTALYFDVGPAFGFVTHAPPGPDHDVLGARVTLAGDLQIWNFTVGAVAGYRGGIPLGGPKDAWEGALSAMLRLGVVLDIPR